VSASQQRRTTDTSQHELEEFTQVTNRNHLYFKEKQTIRNVFRTRRTHRGRSHVVVVDDLVSAAPSFNHCSSLYEDRQLDKDPTQMLLLFWIICWVLGCRFVPERLVRASALGVQLSASRVRSSLKRERLNITRFINRDKYELLIQKNNSDPAGLQSR